MLRFSVVSLTYSRSVHLFICSLKPSTMKIKIISIALAIFAILLVVNSKKSVVNFEVVSHGIAQLIDYLSENYHMKFVIVSTGTDFWAKDLADGILRRSKFSAEVRHFDVINKTNLINFDESCLVLAENHLLIPDFFSTTNKSTFHHNMILAFALYFIDVEVEYVIEAVNDMINTTCPHDYYQLAHSPKNGSLWLMGNQMFYNKSCDSFYHPINYFDSSSMNWTTSKFFNQYSIFNGCIINKQTENAESYRFNKHHYELQLKNLKFLSLILVVFSEKHRIVFKEPGPILNLFRKSSFQDEVLHRKKDSRAVQIVKNNFKSVL